jgi:hypothetical protein
VYELDDAFIVQKVKKFILSIKNNKSAGYNGVPTEVWMMLVTDAEGREF